MNRPLIWIDGAREEFSGNLDDYSGRNIHRDDGPSIEWPSGTKWWCQNGKLHRTDGPALITDSETNTWYQHGQIHRSDGPAYVTRHGESWFWEGRPHRIGGPAEILADGRRTWYLHGNVHREDGPAVEGPHDFRQWWLFHCCYHSNAEDDIEVHREIEMWVRDYVGSWDNWSSEMLGMFKERWKKEIMEIGQRRGNHDIASQLHI